MQPLPHVTPGLHDHGEEDDTRPWRKRPLALMTKIAAPGLLLTLPAVFAKFVLDLFTRY